MCQAVDAGCRLSLGLRTGGLHRVWASYSMALDFKRERQTSKHFKGLRQKSKASRLRNYTALLLLLFIGSYFLWVTASTSLDSRGGGLYKDRNEMLLYVWHQQKQLGLVDQVQDHTSGATVLPGVSLPLSLSLNLSSHGISSPNWFLTARWSQDSRTSFSVTGFSQRCS